MRDVPPDVQILIDKARAQLRSKRPNLRSAPTPADDPQEDGSGQPGQES